MGDRSLNGCLLFARELAPCGVGAHTPDLGEDGLGLVASFNEEALGKVFFGVIEGVEDHGLDLLVGETVSRLDFNFSRKSAALLACGYLENAVGIDEEAHFNAGQAGGHGRNALEVKARQRAAVRGQFALALHDVDGHVGLAVDAGSEVLGGRGGNGGVALDDARDGATKGLNAERERRHVEQQHLLSGLGSAGKDVGLHGCAKGDHFVGIELGVRLFAARAEVEEIVDQRAHRGDARGAADENHFIDLLGRDACVREGLLAGSRRCGRAPAQ